MTLKKIVAITMGDPCGIGPEVVVKALASLPAKQLKDSVVLGDLNILDSLSKRFSLKPKIKAVKDLNKLYDNALNVFNLSNLAKEDILWGKPTINTARATLDYIEKAIELSNMKTVSAIVTAPINKNAISKIVKNFTGHTEYIAEKTGSTTPVMLMVSENMKVIPLTTHMPLKQVANEISEKHILETARIAHYSLKKYFGIKTPKIAVTGLNPHAGEGIFGTEEEKAIIPAINKLNKSGISALGPYSADSVFTKNALRNFDIVLAMYHDQALIPIKTMGFESVVNVTLGIPVIRTSAGHGVAYNIASKGNADAKSMILAIKLARNMAGLNKK